MTLAQAPLAGLLGELATRLESPCRNLPEELFLFASSITPMVNVDLLVRNSSGHILLSWRDDELCGTGWHVPGGVVRFQEPLIERVQKTALDELGCTVTLSRPVPEFTEFIRPDGPTERSHFITFIYHCALPDGLDTPPRNLPPETIGHLAFHDTFPTNMIPVHSFYSQYFIHHSDDPL